MYVLPACQQHGVQRLWTPQRLLQANTSLDLGNVLLDRHRLKRLFAIPVVAKEKAKQLV